MQEAVDFLDDSLAHIRAGKANVKILDGIRVNYYGSPVPIDNVANISTPDQRTIAIIYKLEYLSTAIKNLLDRKEPSNQLDIKKISIKIIDQQYSILVTLGFNINIDFPSSFQYKIKQYLLKKEYKSDNIMELLTYTINDSYIFPICLYFIPDVIVICSIKYLKEKYKLDSINIYELIALSDYDLDKYEIEQCYTFIQKIQKEILFRKRKKEEEMKGAENNKLKTNEASITKVISSINMNVD